MNTHNDAMFQFDEEGTEPKSYYAGFIRSEQSTLHDDSSSLEARDLSIHNERTGGLPVKAIAS